MKTKAALAAVLLAVLCSGGLAEPGAAPFSVKVTGTGRPMILIPGLSCGGQVWDGTVAHFKDRYECHVLTLAGFAGEPAVEAPSLERVRAGISQYIAEKHLDHPVVVGHSLGGFMAFWLGATAPDQAGPLVVVDSVPFFPALLDPTATPQSAKAQAQMMRQTIADQTPAAYAFSLRFILATQITDAKNVERVFPDCAKSDPKAVAQGMYELMTTDLRPKLAAIQAPVLLVGATGSIDDPAQKKRAEENYEAQVATIPGHHVVFAPKSRHFVQLDEPEFLYKEMEAFLAEKAGGGH